MKIFLVIFIALSIQYCNAIDKQKLFVIAEYQGNNKTSIYYFNIDSLLEKQETYNSHNGVLETVCKLQYKNNIFDTLIVIKGVDIGDLLNKLERDNIFQYEFLKSKGINIPFYTIISSEISDISNVLSVADNYSDFKVDSVITESEKTIKFIDFNKNIRFYPSDITMFIPENTFIMNYEYTIVNSTITSEKYYMKDGILIRKYFYENGRIIKVLYDFIESETLKHYYFEKEFKYSCST